MKKILLVGGTGGLGSEIHLLLPEFSIVSTGSKDLDVTNPFVVREKINQISPDIIINLAVINHDATLHRLDEEQVKHQLDVNIRGNINLIKYFIKLCRREEKEDARFIYMSSILSLKPVPGAGIYGACKAFNDHLIKTAALENTKNGITFNSIQLGYFEYGLCFRLNQDLQKLVLDQIPLHRWGTPQELVDLIKLIIYNGYITGQNINLAGGL